MNEDFVPFELAVNSRRKGLESLEDVVDRALTIIENKKWNLNR